MPRKALVKIRAISGSKDTCRYEQIRGEFCVFRGFLCENIARRLRRTMQTLCETLRLCVRKIFLCQESFHTHRICFAFFWDISTKEHILFSHTDYTEFAPLVYLFLVNRLHRIPSCKVNRVICIITLINKLCLRKSAPSAWDNTTPHGSVDSRVRPCPTPQGISEN